MKLPISRVLVSATTLLILVFCCNLGAQIISPPDSGDLLQQQQKPQPEPSLEPERLFPLQAQTGENSGEAFQVNNIILQGNQTVSHGQLKPLLSTYEQRELTLNDLQLLCYDITQFYRQQGYLFSRAVVPQQKVKDGRLRLQIIEARLGEVLIDNNSRVSNDFLNQIVQPVKDETTIAEHSLNRAILLLQDMPSVEVQTSVQAGQSLGLSDLQLKVKSVRVPQKISVNNHGSRQTHRSRLNGSFNFANLAGRSDLLGVSISTSGERMVQFSGNYDIGLGGNGHYGGVSLSFLDYALGENLKDLNAEGQAKSATVYLRSRWQRDLTQNLSSQLGLQRQSLDDQINNGRLQTKRRVDSVTASLNGDIRNWLADASINTWQLTLLSGDVQFENAGASIRDSSTANTQGGFHKINLDLQHLQALTTKLQLSLRFSAQQAFNNLDSSQKKVIAGPNAVRAYDVGTLSGDSAYLINVELQHRFNEYGYGQFSVYGFIDAAQAEVNHQPWAQGNRRNRMSLAGAGLGLRWNAGDSWTAKLFAAAPIGNTPAELGKPKTGVLWLELAMGF